MIELDSEQKKAITKLRNGSILCGGVGTGKSLTALVYFLENVCQGSYSDVTSEVKTAKDLYIITTAKKRDDLEWEREMIPFMLKDKGIHISVDSWNNIKKYEKVKNAFFIFDEQKVVGKGVWAKTFIKIAKNNEWILLTATPGDTWADYIPVFIANGFYKNRTEFVRRHIVYNRYTNFPKIDRYLEIPTLQKNRAKVLVMMKSRKHTKPHKIFEYCSFSEPRWNQLVKDRWDIYNNKPLLDASSLCYAMRRVVNSDFSRYNRLIEVLSKHRKLIVFYNVDYELDILRDLNNITNLKVAEHNGHKHEPLPEGDDWVYLVQYTSGCEAWNCITSNTIVFYSLNYSYKVMTQAAGRIDRRDTPYKDLYYYYFVSKSPIDAGIRQSLSKKKKFNENSWDYIDSAFFS
mgnify:CR=1 FL=1